MRHDLIVRGGRIVDGSGAPAFSADLAITAGRITEIGRVSGTAAEEIDADGQIVTPGFIDVHTHMDAQINWDPLGTCSSWQGVTTVVMGNCGFSVAPVRNHARELVVRNLERAEDISAEAMALGITWSWETFSEYLDALDRLPKGINFSANIGHSALRTWVMGERAFAQPASSDDLAQMDGELRRALKAGAVGFTTSRSPNHLTSDDRPVASRMAEWHEVKHLVNTVGEYGGIFELAQEGAARSTDYAARSEFFNRLRQLAIESGAMITFGILSVGPQDAWQAQLQLLDDAAHSGGRIVGQSHSRGVSILLSFETQLPFDRLPEWQEIRCKPLKEQMKLFRDPALRATLVHAAHYGDYGCTVGAEAPKPNWNTLSVYDGPMPRWPTVAELAASRGIDPVECMIDLALERDMKLFFHGTPHPAIDEELIQIMRNPYTVMSFSDSGAHASQVVDARIQTHLLAHWARDRKAFTIEDAVRMITYAPAHFWGFADRGLLRPGMIADLNVIDLARLSPGMPEIAHDLPGGEQRLIMKACGITATIVNGQVLMRNAEHIGRFPGRILRRRDSNRIA